MYIKSVEFKNWRGFRDESVSFSRPLRSKGVCRIHGENGSGKTAIIEGILACLFGELLVTGDLEFLGRTRSRLDQVGSPAERYGAFIAKYRSLDHKEGSCTSVAVTLGLINDDAEARIRRQWSFGSDDKLIDVEVELECGSFYKRGKSLRSEETQLIDDSIREQLFPPGLASLLFSDDLWELGAGDTRRQLVERFDRCMREFVRLQSANTSNLCDIIGRAAPRDEDEANFTLKAANLKEQVLQSWRSTFSSIMEAGRKSYLSNIAIDDAFNFTRPAVATENAEAISGMFGAGEWHILEVTLRTSIAKVLRGAFPIVFEDPFGRLDLRSRELLIQHFCEVDSQMILLFNNALLSEPHSGLLGTCTSDTIKIQNVGGRSTLRNEV